MLTWYRVRAQCACSPSGEKYCNRSVVGAVVDMVNVCAGLQRTGQLPALPWHCTNAWLVTLFWGHDPPLLLDSEQKLSSILHVALHPSPSAVLPSSHSSSSSRSPSPQPGGISSHCTHVPDWPLMVQVPLWTSRLAFPNPHSHDGLNCESGWAVLPLIRQAKFAGHVTSAVEDCAEDCVELDEPSGVHVLGPGKAARH